MGINEVTVETVMADLKRLGSPKTAITYVRHGIPEGRAYGVSVANLKVIAKTIKGRQDIAEGLYETGNLDAMYLAGIVAKGTKMSRTLLEHWADGAAGMSMIAEYTVPWVTLESEFARDLALKWIRDGSEYPGTSGWSTYSGIVATNPDSALDLAEVESLMQIAIEQVHTAPNRIRQNMNGFVICVGAYVKPLYQAAIRAADQIGQVSVDMGDTACKTPLATESIAKIESMGRIGQKRKTMRC